MTWCQYERRQFTNSVMRTLLLLTAVLLAAL